MRKTDPNTVSKSELAQLLGCSRGTIIDRLAADDAPQPRRGRYPRAATLAFLRRRIVRPGSNTEFDKLRLRRLSAEVEKVELELKLARGEVISLAGIDAEAAQLAESLKLLLVQVFENETPPRCVSQDWVTISKINADGIDRVLSLFKAGVTRIVTTARGQRPGKAARP